MPIQQWSQQDNKRYRGKIDRIYVSMTETYEVDYYVDQYLRTRNYGVNDANRKVIHDTMEKFPGRAPFKRTDLDIFLDGNISRKQ